VRVLAFLALLGIQQSVPGPLVVSLAVTVVAAVAGIWAVATLRR
jgi:chromate transport protein ChrA